MAINLDLTKFEGVGNNIANRENTTPKEIENLVKGYAQDLTQGAAFGQAPHLAGVTNELANLPKKVYGIKNWEDAGRLYRNLGKDYIRSREQFKQENKAFDEEHPYTSFGANIVGGLLTGGALSSVGKSVLKAAIPRAMAEGGVYGLGYGASNTEGKAFDPVGSAIGATAGAVGGAALGGLGQLARRLFLSKNTGRVGDYIRPEGTQEHSMQHILNDKEVAREVAKGGIGKRMSEFTGEAQKSFDNARATIDNAIKQAYEGIDDKTQIGIDRDYIQSIINKVEKNVGSDKESQKILKEAKLILQDMPQKNRVRESFLQKSENGQGYVLPNGQVVNPIKDKGYLESEIRLNNRMLENSQKELNRLEKIMKDNPNVNFDKYPDSVKFQAEQVKKEIDYLQKFNNTAEDILNERKKMLLQKSENGKGYVLPNGDVVDPIKDKNLLKTELKTNSNLLKEQQKELNRLEKLIEDNPNIEWGKYPNDAMAQAKEIKGNIEYLQTFNDTIEGILDTNKNVGNKIELGRLKNLKDRIYRLKNSAYKTEPTGDTKRLVSQDIVDMLDNMYSSLSNAEKRHSPQLKYANEFYSDMKGLNEEVAKINPKGLYGEDAIARAATKQNKDVSGDVFQLAEGNIRKILDKYPQVKNIDKFLTDLKKVQVSSNIKPDENYATSFTIRKIIDHFIKGGSRDQRMQMFAQAVRDGKITKDMLNQEFRKARNIPILTDIINYHLAANKVPSINNLSNIISKSSKVNPYLERYVLPRTTIKGILDRYYNKE